MLPTISSTGSPKMKGTKQASQFLPLKGKKYKITKSTQDLQSEEALSPRLNLRSTNESNMSPRSISTKRHITKRGITHRLQPSNSLDYLKTPRHGGGSPRNERLKNQMHMIKNINDVLHIVKCNGISYSMKWYLNLREPTQFSRAPLQKTIPYAPSFYEKDTLKFAERKGITLRERGNLIDHPNKMKRTHSTEAKGPIQGADFNPNGQIGIFPHIIANKSGCKMEKGEIDFVSKLRDYKRRGNCPIQQKEFELLPDSPQYNALGFDIYKESKTPLRFRNKYTMKMNSSLQGNMDDTLASKMFNASNIRKEALTPLLSMEAKEKYNEKYPRRNVGHLRDFIMENQKRCLVQWESGLRNYSKVNDQLAST